MYWPKLLTTSSSFVLRGISNFVLTTNLFPLMSRKDATFRVECSICNPCACLYLVSFFVDTFVCGYFVLVFNELAKIATMTSFSNAMYELNWPCTHFDIRRLLMQVSFLSVSCSLLSISEFLHLVNHISVY